jgi:hypothetical protein
MAPSPAQHASILQRKPSATIQCTPLSGNQRFTFVNNLRVSWVVSHYESSTVVTELENHFGQGLNDPLPAIRLFLGQDGSAPIITSKPNYERLKAHYGLNTLRVRLANETEAQLLRQAEINDHWVTSVDNFNWLYTQGLIAFQFIEWWASQNYHYSHNCELRVRANNLDWAYVHIHYEDRRAVGLANMSFVHLKATRLGASIGAIDGGGAAAQALQLVVDANLATIINPAPWVVCDRTDQAEAGAAAAAALAQQADLDAAQAAAAVAGINTAVGHSVNAALVVNNQLVIAQGQAATAHLAAQATAGHALNAQGHVATARTFPSPAQNRYVALQQAEADVLLAQANAQNAVNAKNLAVAARALAIGARVQHPVMGGWAAIANAHVHP